MSRPTPAHGPPAGSRFFYRFFLPVAASGHLLAHPLLLKRAADDRGAALLLLLLSVTAVAPCFAGRSYSKQNLLNRTKSTYTLLLVLDLGAACLYLLGLLLLNDHTPSN